MLGIFSGVDARAWAGGRAAAYMYEISLGYTEGNSDLRFFYKYVYCCDIERCVVDIFW